MATAMQALPAPRDYEEFASGGWCAYISRVAHGCGVPAQEVPDLTSDITLYIIERDALSTYDPDRAPFSTYLRGYVVKRSRSWLRDRARQLRELRFNAPLAQRGYDEDLTVEDVVGLPDAMYDYVVSWSALEGFEDYLDTHGERDLADLYACLFFNVMDAPTVQGAQTQSDMEGYTRLRYRLAQDLNIKKSTVDRWISRLKVYAEEYGLFEGV